MTASAPGGGDGSLANPWTLSEAMTNAVAGDVVQLGAGVYVGTNPGGTLNFTPAFRPTNSGTSGNPIIFIAENLAAQVTTGYTDIRSGATTSQSGWPAFGSLTKDYIEWWGIYSNEGDTNNKGATDSGTCSIWTGTGLKAIGCKIIGETGYSDNHSGIRLENCVSPEISDNNISGYTGGTNKAGIIIYKTQNATLHHNTIFDCNHGIQPKGASGSSTIYGLTIRQNLIYDCSQMFRFHGPVKGPSSELSEVYQNIGYDLVNVAEFTSSGTHTGEQDGLRIYNNTFENVSDGDWWLNHNYDANRDNLIFNNIVRTTAAYLRGTYAGASDVTHHDDFATWSRNCISGATNFGDGTSSSALDSLTFSDWQTTYSQDANSITSDPLFTNVTNHDFTLQGGSPCLTLGRDTLGTFGAVDATIPAGAYVTGSETIGVRS